MNRTSFCLMTGIVIVLTTGTLPAADAWKHASVLPKDPSQLVLRGNATRPGSEYAANAFQIAWPSHVEQTDGQWILIGDKGGYSVPPVKGWVRKEEMLPMQQDDSKKMGEDPPSYLSTQILQTSDPARLAGLYWLRGIYWESQQEPEVAVTNFVATIRSAFGQKVDLGQTDGSLVELFTPDQNMDAARDAIGRFPGLADAYLRLARLTAKSASRSVLPKAAAPASGAAKGQGSASEPWTTYFACADYLFRLGSPSGGATSKVPSADTEWADAIAADYQRQLRQPAAPSTRRATAAVGRNRLGKAVNPPTQPADSQAEATANRADALYQSALAVNPTWSDAFLGRGKLMMAKGKSLGRGKGTSSSQQCQALYAQAIQQFTLAIQLDPKSKQAFRNRAEAYQALAVYMAKNTQLQDRYEDRIRLLSQAAQSADKANQLGNDRDPACLELMASVIENCGDVYTEWNKPKNAANATSSFKQASNYWQAAAACPDADRSQVRLSASQCRQKLNDQEQLRVTSSRGTEDEAAQEPPQPFYVPGANLFGDSSR